jgi:HEAT repeat protein
MDETSRENLWASCLAAVAEDDLEAAGAIAQDLLGHGPAAIAVLVDALTAAQSEPEERWFTSRLLADGDADVVVPLVVAQLHPDLPPDALAAAIDLLVQLGQPAIAHLTQLLDQPSQRRLALTALARIRRSPCIEPLITVTEDRDATLRAIALEALSSFHDERIPPLLLRGIQDPAAAVRQAAVVGLGLRADLLPDMPFVDSLSRCLGDDDPPVVLAAVTALGRCPQPETIALLATVQPDWDTELGVRLLQVYGWIDSPASIAALADRLPHLPIDSDAALAAIRSLGQQRQHPEAATQVLACYLLQLTNQSPMALGARSRQELATALGNLPSPGAVELLIQLLTDADAAVGWQAAYCLQRRGSHLRATLVDRLADAQLPIRHRLKLEECLANWPPSG